MPVKNRSKSFIEFIQTSVPINASMKTITFIVCPLKRNIVTLMMGLYETTSTSYQPVFGLTVTYR